ncbi:MAG TPA: hypothetical protein VFX86_01550 [Candidatus Saccharimonadales bacterium]|nr:hypothetical protein [Candidatus Saccharimonadales bacterium]
MTYSSSISMGRRRFARRHQNAVSMAEQARTIGPISNSIVLVLLSCLLGILYLTQVTKTNATGYKINQLKEEYSQLQKDHAELELSAARLQSMDRVAGSPVTKNLVSVAPTTTVQ